MTSFDPLYVHILLNHFPLIGLMIATGLLAWGLLKKDRSLQNAACVLMIGIGVLCPLVLWSGEEGAERIEPLLDSVAHHWLEIHEERAEVGQFFFYLPAVLALLSFFVKEHLRSWALRIALVISLVGLGYSVLIYKSGGQIRHSEFRTNAPLPITEENQSH